MNGIRNYNSWQHYLNLQLNGILITHEISSFDWAGSMAQQLELWNCNPASLGSIPALAASWICYRLSPEFASGQFGEFLTLWATMKTTGLTVIVLPLSSQFFSFNFNLILEPVLWASSPV